MKNASIFSTVLLHFVLLLMSQTMYAQWSQSTTAIYPSNLTKKVGIGLNDPYLALEIKGGVGLRNTSNGFLGSLTDDGTGNLSIISYSSPFIGSVPKHILLNPTPIYGKSGNVGIGGEVPTDAKLVVQGAIGNTVAIFRKSNNSRGLAMVSDWPGLYLNAYYNSGAKAMAGGYSGIVNFDPDFGRIDFGVTGFAATAPNDPIDLPTRMSIDKDGRVSIGGPSNALFGVTSNLFSELDNTASFYNPAIGPHISHIHFGTKGDWYIRSAADDGNVVIQDNGGTVSIGGASGANGYKLSVNGKVICEELKVQLRGAWPDYVFAPNYNLRPLEEVEAHIKTVKHLPGIPAAKEVENEGITVGEMQVKMMEKIEELTLYLIELKKENDALKARVVKLEQR